MFFSFDFIWKFYNFKWRKRNGKFSFFFELYFLPFVFGLILIKWEVVVFFIEDLIWKSILYVFDITLFWIQIKKKDENGNELFWFIFKNFSQNKNLAWNYFLNPIFFLCVKIWLDFVYLERKKRSKSRLKKWWTKKSFSFFFFYLFLFFLISFFLLYFKKKHKKILFLKENFLILSK